MKKTMFITSVIMVVVLAIALTTSSLAWFTAGGATSVGTQTINLSSVSAESAASGLEITKDTSIGWQTSAVALATPSALRPMCPVTYTSKSAVSSDEFYQAVNAMAERKITARDGVPYFVSPTAAGITGTATPYSDTLYIHNSGVNQIGVNASITIALNTASASTVGSANLWVAVFDITNWSSQSNTGAVLMALDCSNAQLDTPITPNYLTYAPSSSSFGEFANADDLGARCDSISGSTNGVSPANINSVATIATARTVNLEPGQEGTAAFEPGATHTIVIYAWYDGTSLIAQNVDTVVTISVSFSQTTAVSNS